MSDPQGTEPPPPPQKEGGFPWLPVGCVVLVLAAAVVIAIPGVLASSRSSNDRNAHWSLKTLVTAEADFRSNDRDENLQNDFWVGDVRGLYELAPKGSAIMVIEPAIAQADPFPAVKLGPRATGRLGPPGTKSGYHFAAIPLMADGKPYDDGSGHNLGAFGFCCWPAKYPEAARWTFIVNEDATIWKKDNAGARVMRWPADPKAEGWVKAD